MRRLLHEAMDAGGCGWSAQRLHPDGPGAVQRDYDGGPMVTDVMHDETALAARARCSPSATQGFMQMTLATADGAHDFLHIEELAQVSGRPMLYNVVAVIRPLPRGAPRAASRGSTRAGERGVRVYGQGVTTDAGLHLHVRGLEPLRRRPGVARGDARHAEERKAKLADPARRPRCAATSRASSPSASRTSRSSSAITAATQAVREPDRRRGRGADRQAPGRRDARHRRRRRPADASSTPSRPT